MDHVFLFVIFCLLYISLRWNLGYYLINFISRPKFSSFYDIHYGSNPVVKGVFVFFTVLVTAVVFQVWQIDVIVLVRGFVSWCHEALLLHIREPLHHRCSGNTESRWVIKPQEEGIAQSQRQDLFVADANNFDEEIFLSGKSWVTYLMMAYAQRCFMGGVTRVPALLRLRDCFSLPHTSYICCIVLSWSRGHSHFFFLVSLCFPSFSVSG